LKKLKMIIVATFVLIILATSLTPGFSASDLAPEPVKIPILMYHHIAEIANTEMVVTLDKFRSDMSYLKNAHYNAIFVEDLIAYLNGVKELPENPIMITFDDGYTSNYTYAYPIAKELGMKMTISIIGWSMGRSFEMNGVTPIIPHFTWEEAVEMTSSGLISLQNHTFDLHSPPGKSFAQRFKVNRGVLPLAGEHPKAYERRLTRDLMRHSIDMRERLGKQPEIICYPYGAYTKLTEQLVKSMGFTGSFSTKPGVRTYASLDDLWEMPRFNVDESTDLSVLLSIEN